MSKLKVISLFGGPGSGKSTTAAGLFYEMKKLGLNVEYSQEYAKDMVFENRMNILGDQLYILAKQHRRIARMQNTVDWVITDGPFLLGLIYVPDDYLKTFEPLVLELWEQYQNYCFMLDRNNIEYQEVGRYQTKDQALTIDDKLHRLLNSRRIPHTTVKTGENTINDILKSLKLQD
jgi:nicotinamide riboside kinase